MSFLSLIDTYVENKLQEMHTAIPGRIVDYDPVKQEAVVQPLIKRRYYDAEGAPEGLVEQPAIVAVPVIFPSANTGIISFPIKKGDFVLIIFSESSVDNFNFSNGDQPVDPEDMRRFNYSDAIAIPGLYPFNKAIGSDPDNLAIRFNANTSKEVSIKLKPNGDCLITTPGKTIVQATGNVEVTTGGNATVNATGNATLTAAQTTINSPTTINGATLINGTLGVSGMLSAGAGLAITGAGTATGTLTASDVIAGGKAMAAHTHNSTSPGTPTTVPLPL